MALAPLALWETCLSHSLGLYPENVRGWSGHFQSHFLSTWEQAAPGLGAQALEPCPVPVRLSGARATVSPSSHDQSLAALLHLSLPSAEELFYHLSIRLHPVPGEQAHMANTKAGKQRRSGGTARPQDSM